MQRRPLQHKGMSAAWKLAPKNFQRVDTDNDPMLSVVGVKVRTPMLVMVHPDRDAKKPTDRRH